MPQQTAAFLTRGGEIGALMQRMDWSQSALGYPTDWPAALKTTVGLLLTAKAQIVLFWGPEFIALYNDAYAPTIGLKHPQALGRPGHENWAELWDDLHPLLQSVRDTGETVFANDRAFYIERHGYPETVYFDLSYSPVFETDGSIGGVLCIVSETTKRVEGETRLRESEARFRNMADHAPVMMWVTDHLGQCTYLNRSWYAFTGQQPGEGDGLGWLEMVHPEDRKKAADIFTAAGERGEPFRLEYRLRRADGVYRWAIDAASPRFTEDGAFLGYIGSVIDIDDRYETEQRVRESEARLQAISNSIDHMVWSARADGYVDYYNDRWHEFTGVPQGASEGSAWRDVIHPDDRARTWARWHESLVTGQPYHIEYRMLHRSGKYLWALGRALPVKDSDGHITRWFGTCTEIQAIVDAREVLARSREELEKEITKRTAKLIEAENRLRQAQKMEAVGQLTGGIAHDFNNMLAVIISGLTLMQRRLARGDTNIAPYIEGAMDGAQRAAALTERLLAFARQQPLAPQIIDANSLINGMSELLLRALGEQVMIEMVRAAGLWRTHVDPNQLENALINLAVNARDAMPAGGRLTVETANAYIDDAYGAEHEVQPGQYVLIAVSDTGEGMSPDVLARAFDPFFTTKGVGRGTGLGLSQVFGFVRQSGGHVKIYSEQGHGTCVKIYLPRHYGDAAPYLRRSDAQPDHHAQPGEVVLVVEDEERVRRFSVEALRELGYTVVEACGGREALSLIEAGCRPSLLFTDVVMPEMTGRQLADKAQLLLPGLKVLYTTGYTRNAVVHNGVLDPGTHFLQKPFGLDALAAKVRETLDGNS
jgi:PAS domain S-box-containing protein